MRGSLGRTIVTVVRVVFIFILTQSLRLYVAFLRIQQLGRDHQNGADILRNVMCSRWRRARAYKQEHQVELHENTQVLGG